MRDPVSLNPAAERLDLDHLNHRHDHLRRVQLALAIGRVGPIRTVALEVARRDHSTVAEVAASHAVYVSRPEAVADIVRQAAAARHAAPA